MYKRILVPTDGSALSGKAIKSAVQLAKACRARLIGIYVISPYIQPTYYEGSAYMANMSQSQYKLTTEKAARAALAAIEKQAKSAGVTCSVIHPTASLPWQAIVGSARSKKCDLIVMASHGRRGFAGLLLGSETTKVLTHSKIPVLVCR